MRNREAHSTSMIDNAIVKDYYDVVVVGAGIGGITAGALLAKKGVDVLVVDQHYLPGGVCSAIRRNGIAMDVGAAMLFGWSEDMTVHRFIMNELEEPINVIPHDCYYNMHFGDKSVTFWKDFDRFFQELNEAFPGKEDQFRGFYDHTRAIYDDMMANLSPFPMDAMPKADIIKMLLKNPKRTMRLQKYMGMSLKDVLDLYVKDPVVENLFDLLIATCYCTRIDETPLILSAAIVWEAFNGGAVYPQGSPQMLPNALERSVEKFGGQMLYRHMVDKILIKDNQAYGVLLDNGSVIHAGSVISDATIWNLYGKLIDESHISPERMSWAKNFQPTESTFLLFLGVKDVVIPEGTKAIEVFVNDLNNFTNDSMFCYIPSIDDPSICPKGTHSITALCSAKGVSWPGSDSPEYQSDDYRKLKEIFAQKALDILEKKFPGLKDNIIIMDTATPTTIERFTRKNLGNIGGPKQAIGQHLLNRLHSRSEFENLYCVGDSTVMGEGVVSVSSSAIGAVNMYLQDTKQNKKQYKVGKYKKHYINYVEGQPRAELPDKGQMLTETTASRIATECQWCEREKSECMKMCPAGIDVLNFIRRLESKNYIGAAKSMREMNPLSGVCGFVCPAEKLCESKCAHKDFSDESVRIKQLQSWVCEQAGAQGFVKEVPKQNGKRVAVVGAGPAGLSCAHFLARLGYRVEIFEKKHAPGGMLTSGIPAYRLPRDVVSRELEGILLPNISIRYASELGKNVLINDLSRDYDAVFVAPGLWQGKRIPISGIDEARSIDALSMVVQYNETGELDLHGNVLILGGGSVATDAAQTAVRAGAQSVKLLCLECASEMPAQKEEIDCIKELGVEIINSWGPSKVLGGKLECISCTSVYDETGAFRPRFEEAVKRSFEFDTIIFAVGQAAEPELAKHLEESMKDRFTCANDKTMLVKDNIFAGGDILRGAGTVVEAVADGRRAAMGIDEMLRSAANLSESNISL